MSQQHVVRSRFVKWGIPALVVVALAIAATVVWLGDGAAAKPFRELTPSLSVDSKAPANLRAEVDNAVARPPFREVAALGDVVHVTPDGDLPRAVTLRFTLSQAVDSLDDVLLAVNRTGAEGDWELVRPDRIADDRRSVEVTTTHLSWWQPLWRKVTDLVGAVGSELRKGLDALTGDVTAEAEKPSCRDEQQARDLGYTVTSAGDSLYWCLGLDQGRPVLRVVNKRRYPLLVGHPNLTPTYVARADWGWESLSRRLTADGKLTLMPFDEAVFSMKLEDGGSAAVGAEYNGQAQSLYQLQFGVVTALNILDRFGAGTGVISNGRIIKTQFDRVAHATAKFMQIKECGELVFKLDQVNPGTLLNACFDADKIMTVFGWKGLLIAPAMVAGPIVNFFRSEFNAIGDLLNQRDRYALTVKYTRKEPIDRFVGEWRVHGSTVVYRRDLTGTETWNEGPCNYTEMCTAYAKLKLRLNSDGTLHVSVVSVEVKDGKGNPPFDSGTDEYRAGTAYAVSYVAPGHLRRKGDFGNPNLCGKNASKEVIAQCGA